MYKKSANLDTICRKNTGVENPKSANFWYFLSKKSKLKAFSIKFFAKKSCEGGNRMSQWATTDVRKFIPYFQKFAKNRV